MLNRLDHDDVDKGVIVLAILFSMMALMAPFVMVVVFQELFFYGSGQWLLTRPALSYIVVIGSFLTVPAAAIIYAFAGRWRRKRHPAAGAALFLILSLAAIPAAASGLLHYYTMDEDGITWNPLLSFEAETYAWSEVEVIEMQREETDGTAGYAGMNLELEDGTRLELDMNMELVQQRRTVMNAVEEAGGEVRN
ncbi:hypothetical protein [Alkalicoccus urumqiensis]|uniref:Uncharacterized protein n=1 Tax=Alkalicoccus urumqiensis TaxID=1548213 RepID=A0A2P6MLD0_ALKUR|nr:hypothetical protein [Alkalicoccus urumqiensis]PRO67092.1 hypothetical protein C6I21_00550 [Alkalicoccus urumqiensis]